MPHWHAAVDEWFGSHHGVAAVHDLIRLGMSEATAHRMVRQGRLDRLMPGVLRSLQWPAGDLQVYAAACARNPAAMVGFTSACREWGFRRVNDRRLHILVPHGVSPELPDVVVHRCRRIDPVDIVDRGDGIRLTSPPRSLFDSADMLGVSATRSVLEQILSDGMATFGTISDTVARLAHMNRPGTRTMQAVIASRPAWRSALQSDLEVRVLDEIERSGLPQPVTQCPVRLRSGRVIHLDVGWPEFQVGLEVDHPAWHSGLEDRRRDAARDRQATAVGWAVARVVSLDVELGLRPALADVALIIDRRR